MSPRVGEIAVIVVLFAASGVFALTETAFVKASRIKLHALAEDGDRRAQRVIGLLEHQERTLNSVLLLLLGCQMVSASRTREAPGKMLCNPSSAVTAPSTGNRSCHMKQLITRSTVENRDDAQSFCTSF